jgi:hypothetical protein
MTASCRIRWLLPDGAEHAVGANADLKRFANREVKQTAISERQETMKAQIPQTVSLGELILTVFDEAAQLSGDAEEVSRLAAQTVARMVGHGRSPRPSRRA